MICLFSVDFGNSSQKHPLLDRSFGRLVSGNRLNHPGWVNSVSSTNHVKNGKGLDLVDF